MSPRRAAQPRLHGERGRRREFSSRATGRSHRARCIRERHDLLLEAPPRIERVRCRHTRSAPITAIGAVLSLSSLFPVRSHARDGRAACDEQQRAGTPPARARATRVSHSRYARVRLERPHHPRLLRTNREKLKVLWPLTDATVTTPQNLRSRCIVTRWSRRLPHSSRLLPNSRRIFEPGQ